MLTSFFGKSTPLNYILLCIILIVGYVTTRFMAVSSDFSLVNLPKHLGIILLLVFTLLLLDFIIRKNNVTQNNTYAIFIFTLFVIMIPAIYQDIYILLSNVFLLLSTRRVLSLNSEKNTEKKIFDAAMYVAIASLFHFWCILYVLVLIAGIITKTERNPRYFLIPVVAFFAIFIVKIAYNLIVQDSLYWFETWPKGIDFNFLSFNLLALIVPVLLIVGLLLWTSSVRFFQLPSLSKKEKPAASSMIIISVVLLAITLLGPHEQGSELLFLLMPAAITTTNFVENRATRERTVFNEVLLWLILVIAIVNLFL